MEVEQDYFNLPPDSFGESLLYPLLFWINADPDPQHYCCTVYTLTPYILQNVPVKATRAGRRAVKLQSMMVGRKSFRKELPDRFY